MQRKRKKLPIFVYLNPNSHLPSIIWCLIISLPICFCIDYCSDSSPLSDLYLAYRQLRTALLVAGWSPWHEKFCMLWGLSKDPKWSEERERETEKKKKGNAERFIGPSLNRRFHSNTTFSGLKDQRPECRRRFAASKTLWFLGTQRNASTQTHTAVVFPPGLFLCIVTKCLSTFICCNLISTL